ncbi:hypothetical protein L345_09157, partial [Ophiophagus hannah]
MANLFVVVCRKCALAPTMQCALPPHVCATPPTPPTYLHCTCARLPANFQPVNLCSLRRLKTGPFRHFRYFRKAHFLASQASNRPKISWDVHTCAVQVSLAGACVPAQMALCATCGMRVIVQPPVQAQELGPDPACGILRTGPRGCPVNSEGLTVSGPPKLCFHWQSSQATIGVELATPTLAMPTPAPEVKHNPDAALNENEFDTPVKMGKFCYTIATARWQILWGFVCGRRPYVSIYI